MSSQALSVSVASPSFPRLIGVRLALADYAGMGEAFSDLSARAGEGNPHQSPGAAEALFGGLADPADAVILAASAPDESDRLMGVWVMRLARPRWALGQPVLKAPAYPVFEPLSLPVLDAAQGAAAMAAMLAALIADPLLPRLIHCPSLPCEGSAFEAITQTLAAHGGRLTSFNEWARATFVLPPDGDIPGWMGASFGKRFRRLETKRKALAAQGEVAFHLHGGRACIAATRRFLALEATGWKGKAGSAMANDARDAAFALGLAEKLGPQGQMNVAELTLDGRTIASAILPMGGGTVSFFKTAYDELLKAQSPGVILDMEITRSLAAMPGFRLMDSGMDDSAPPESTMWPGRRAMCHGLIALGPAPAAWIAAHGLGLRQRLRNLKQQIGH
jgi:CelD/BcsL family acetyltransferase involved in cellulose biosynthesis